MGEKDVGHDGPCCSCIKEFIGANDRLHKSSNKLKSDYAALEAERDRLREAINKIASGCQHTKRAKCLGHSTEINPWDFVYCNECCRIARRAREE